MKVTFETAVHSVTEMGVTINMLHLAAELKQREVWAVILLLPVLFRVEKVSWVLSFFISISFGFDGFVVVGVKLHSWAVITSYQKWRNCVLAAESIGGEAASWLLQS